MPKANVSVLDLMCKDKYDDANNHKRNRDKLREESKLYVLRRNEYNERARSSIEKAKMMRGERDRYNAQVKELKEKRNECQTKAAELKETKGPEYDRLREEANNYHNEMVEAYDKSQKCHESMTRLFEDADASRSIANGAHNKAIECNKTADEEHKLYIEALDSIRKLRDEIPDFDIDE